MNYTVNQNDTAYSIAQRFGVPANELMSYNNLSPNSFLFPGTVIVIPPRFPSGQFPPFFPPVFPRPPQNRIYIVRRGDTLFMGNNELKILIYLEKSI